jgi:hypothetical protein
VLLGEGQDALPFARHSLMLGEPCQHGMAALVEHDAGVAGHARQSRHGLADLAQAGSFREVGIEVGAYLISVPAQYSGVIRLLPEADVKQAHFIA